MCEGKGPVHTAVVEGFISVLKTILKFRPDLEMEVSYDNIYVDVLVIAARVIQL